MQHDTRADYRRFAKCPDPIDAVSLQGRCHASVGGELIAPVVEAGSMSGTRPPNIQVDDDLALRAWRPEDAPVVVEAFSDPAIQHWHFRRYDTEAESLRWIEACSDEWSAERSATWAIVWSSTAEVVGRVTIYTSLADGCGEVSYWVLPRSRRQGIASRACIAATLWAHELGLHRVQLEHSVENEASRRVAIRAGFLDEGVRRGAHLHADGWHDMRMYGHLESDRSHHSEWLQAERVTPINSSPHSADHRSSGASASDPEPAS